MIEADGWNAPTTSPKLTGSFHLKTGWEIHPIVHLLCALPIGLHFTKTTEAESIVMGLVSRCSDTPKSLSATCLTLVSAFPDWHPLQLFACR